MTRIITQDGTVISGGVSRPYQADEPRPSRRGPPTSADPRERDPYADRGDRSYEAYRQFSRRL